jgi:hypothetical protein
MKTPLIIFALTALFYVSHIIIMDWLRFLTVGL